MIRTQIQLPDEIYYQAKKLAEAKEVSLADILRRGVEYILSVYPNPEKVDKNWTLPQLDIRLKTPLEALKQISISEEESRGAPRRKR